MCLFFRYAEIPSEVKNSISHRGKALQAMKEYFISLGKNSQEPKNKRTNISKNDQER